MKKLTLLSTDSCFSQPYRPSFLGFDGSRSHAALRQRPPHRLDLPLQLGLARRWPALAPTDSGPYLRTRLLQLPGTESPMPRVHGEHDWGRTMLRRGTGTVIPPPCRPLSPPCSGVPFQVSRIPSPSNLTSNTPARPPPARRCHPMRRSHYYITGSLEVAGPAASPAFPSDCPDHCRWTCHQHRHRDGRDRGDTTRAAQQRRGPRRGRV